MCLVFNSSSVDKEDKEKSKKNLQLLNEVWKVVTTFTEPAVNMIFFYLLKHMVLIHFN